MLPDVERLARARDIASFAIRLRAIGYDARLLASIAKAGERLDDALRAPMRTWHLRKHSDEAAIAARLFFDADDVSEPEARAALADVGPWLDAGLVTRDGDRFSSPWRIVPFGASFVIGDALRDDVDAVMAVGGSTIALARAAIPNRPVARACDLGCGAGAIALAMAPIAETVLALDVNPRAVTLASINARMNAVTNVVARAGDWLAPAAGERFSLVATQPPFAARANRVPGVTFLHGGARGDELALAAIAELEAHLEDDGLAFVQCDWPVVGDDEIATRVRAAFGARADLIFFRAPNQDLDEVVAHYASARHVELGRAYRDEAITLREHFERIGVRATCTGLAVTRPARRDRGDGGFTAQIPVRHAHDAPITRIAVDRFFSAATLAHADDATLDRATFVLAPGISLAEAPDLGDGARGAIVRASAEALVHAFAISADETSALTALLDGARDGRTRRVARSLLLRGALVAQNVPTAPR